MYICSIITTLFAPGISVNMSTLESRYLCALNFHMLHLQAIMPKRTSQAKINWLSTTYFSMNLISIHQILCAFLSDRHVSLLPLLLIISVSMLNVAHNDDVLMIRWNVMQNMFTNQYPVTPGTTLSNSYLISFVYNILCHTVQISHKLFNLKKK